MRVKGPFPYHSRQLLRRCGYAEVSKRNGQVSYAKRASRAPFPRFHVYLREEAGNDLVFTIHLDQKAACYGGVSAHSGEYDGPAVEAEAARLKQMLSQARQV